MFKKITLIIIVTVICLAAVYLVGTGFRKASNEALIDYSVSEDGTELTFHVETWESIGYVRGFKDKNDGVKAHYLTFYHTFGGINSSFRSKNTFVLEIAPDDTEIYFNRANGEYELVLVKDEETGQWFKPNEIGK